MKSLWVLFITLILLFSASGAKCDEHLVYDGNPIHITLMLGQERQIVFPDNITVGIPQKLLGNFQTRTPVGNRLFIEPKTTFKDQRILVKGENGKTYVIYLTAIEKGEPALDQVVRIHKKPIESSADTQTGMSDQSQSVGEAQEGLSYRYLTQFVFRKLYAPKRLELNDSRLTRVSIDTKPTRNLFSCSRGNYSCVGVLSTPLISYRTQNSLYVSAIELKNISDTPIDINPTLLNTQVLAATSFHGRLLPSSYEGLSTTVLVIVHKWPLRDLLK